MRSPNRLRHHQLWPRSLHPTVYAIAPSDLDAPEQALTPTSAVAKASLEKAGLEKASPKTKVLYIAGFERSGSTILNRVLGQIEGFVAWGELRDIWEHGSVENRLCSCGSPFNRCKAWSKIIDQALLERLNVSPTEMVTLKQQTRSSLLLKTLLRSFGVASGTAAPNRLLSPYEKGLTQLYQTIQQKTQSRVIVDSSKASWYGYILSQLPDIDLYTVHIIRDPRGVCHSLQRRKQQGEPECQWYNPGHAALSWMLKNMGVEKLLKIAPDRYYQVRYEDFVARPQAIVEQILQLVDVPTTELPFVEKNTVTMGLDHIITGSPSSRCAVGSVKIKASEKWMSELNKRDRFLIEKLAFPLLKKYGCKT